MQRRYTKPSICGKAVEFACRAEPMKLVHKALLQAISEDPELQQLPLAVGKGPKRSPPSEAAMACARARVAKALEILADEAEAEHRLANGDTTSSMQSRSVAATQTRCYAIGCNTAHLLALRKALRHVVCFLIVLRQPKQHLWATTS